MNCSMCVAQEAKSFRLWKVWPINFYFSQRWHWWPLMHFTDFRVRKLRYLFWIFQWSLQPIHILVASSSLDRWRFLYIAFQQQIACIIVGSFHMIIVFVWTIVVLKSLWLTFSLIVLFCTKCGLRFLALSNVAHLSALQFCGFQNCWLKPNDSFNIIWLAYIWMI
jgi:hypothetical protein